MLVDDVEANLIALQADLEHVECDCVRAHSGNEALAWLLKREFALMLLDVQMPGMDGYEVARLARENPTTRDVPIVFVTAMHETESNALRGYGAGAIDFLFKPINSTILRSKVQVFVDLYRSRRRLFEEVKAHERTLAELNAFNYSVSHDLRAPLRPLQGFSRALLEDYSDKLDAVARDYLQRISDAAARMQQLIDDLLNLSQAGRADLHAMEIDLLAPVQQIIDELKQTDPARTMTFVLPTALPAFADNRLLRIVFENFLRDAWKFTAKVEAPKIEIGASTKNNTPAYFVRDNGAGFDPAYAKKLFKPFQRLHSREEFEGTGIGLAIVERIIARHGGEVWAESAPGQGATFFFTLPKAL